MIYLFIITFLTLATIFTVSDAKGLKSSKLPSPTYAGMILMVAVANFIICLMAGAQGLILMSIGALSLSLSSAYWMICYEKQFVNPFASATPSTPEVKKNTDVVPKRLSELSLVERPTSIPQRAVTPEIRPTSYQPVVQDLPEIKSASYEARPTESRVEFNDPKKSVIARAEHLGRKEIRGWGDLS